MAATPTGEAGPSVTSLVVVDTGRGHAPVPILYPSMAGSTARILATRCSLMCVIQGPVLVSIIKDSLRTFERVTPSLALLGRSSFTFSLRGNRAKI